MASWRESSLPGKGRVLLAARDVARGETVLQAVDTNSGGSSEITDEFPCHGC